MIALKPLKFVIVWCNAINIQGVLREVLLNYITNIMSRFLFTRSLKMLAVGCGMALLTLSFVIDATASSHREAPLITSDPKADATDVYAFVSPKNDDSVVLIANYMPFQEPAGGPNFYFFDDTVRYEINVDNDGDAQADIVYRFEFDSTYQSEDTFLYATGPVDALDAATQNYRQTYTLTKIVDGTATVLVSDAPVPPSNIGPKTYPDYDEVMEAAYIDLPSGGQVFAGQIEDPFYVDLGAAFDLLNVRELPGNNGGGVDALAGFNVHSLVIEVPTSEVTSDGSTPTDVTDPAAVVGVWTSSYRQSTRVLNGDGTVTNSGDWVQVSRLGQPLVNEVVIPVGQKDRFNSSAPSGDAQFANYVANPEFPVILNLLFGIFIPPQGDFGTADQRDDLITIFLTGIPGLNQPAGVTPSEQLRLNLAVPVTEDPNRLGVIAGDAQGFPNGRRLGDDVIDIALRVMAGAAYPLFHPEFVPDEVGVQLGDGVDANDRKFKKNFPYVFGPYSGFDSNPHKNAKTKVPKENPGKGPKSSGGSSASAEPEPTVAGAQVSVENDESSATASSQSEGGEAEADEGEVVEEETSQTTAGDTEEAGAEEAESEVSSDEAEAITEEPEEDSVETPVAASVETSESSSRGVEQRVETLERVIENPNLKERVKNKLEEVSAKLGTTE